MGKIDDLLSYVVSKALIIKGDFDVLKLKKESLNPQKINNELLMSIIKCNKDTEYGRKYNFNKIKTVEDFRKYVPIVEYKDIEDYCERIYDTNEPNVLCKDRVIGFCRTSGSIGKSKKIPKTKKDINAYERYTVTRFISLANKYNKKINGNPIKPGKGISLLLHDPTVSEINMPSSNVADIAEKKYRAIEKYMLILPLGRQFEVSEIEENYAFSRFGLEYKDCSFIFFVFAKGVSEFIEYIKDNWQKLANEIELGIISKDEPIKPEVRKELEKRLKPNPKRANEIRKECEKGFDETIIKRLWPNLSVISMIATSASFEGFCESIKKYTKGISLDYSIYGASEALMAAAYETNNPKQVLLPNSCYYEFVEEDDEDLKNILSIDDLKPGKNYEVILTNQSGFYRYRIKDVIRVLGYYNNCPVINFVYRKGQLLNIASEKTTIEHMNEVIKRFSKLTNTKINEWAVTIGKGENRYRYVILLESPDNKDLSKYSDEFEKILSEVNETYGRYKFTIEKPLILNQRIGAHKEWFEYKAKSGAPVSQIKPVKNIDTKEKEDFFFSRLV